MTRYTTTLFIFRRDLRLVDNTALLRALKESQPVIPCFIFDPRQVTNENSYKSDRAIDYMCGALTDLDKELRKKGSKLYVYQGEAENVVRALLKNNTIDAVYCNKDYTPFSVQRDAALKVVCDEFKRDFIATDDALLNAPEAVHKDDGKPYTVFTPFFKRSQRIPVHEVQEHITRNFYTGALKIAGDVHAVIPTSEYHGGRAEALKILKNIEQWKDYAQTHDIPALNNSRLSVHLKFGAISVREAYHAIAQKLGKAHPLIRQLYWRDFYTHIAYHFPRVFGQAFIEKYNNLTWSKSTELFVRWCTGTTGFPLVDAGMRELNETGFMHNRVRMVVASFLVKDLHINWQWGEKYFAQQLIDYDPAVNNGNWQWAASTGCDPQPYFRIFNPWLQQKKFDPLCIYIKQWIPELRDLDVKAIHQWYKAAVSYQGYPVPMVDHGLEAARAKGYFKAAKEQG